ncbi:hypothetical protein DNHGIG_15320 [Collibacillus ludicampi]|uniref:DUF3800 domain-containing protein n=1 Tax=Collibacillus ludicampi TaxID=2771369 RepID=A0AAV4LDY7_9BACL|nr:DUF3800 domain-containing protein [Collibacillus ludicampi]GIM45983.1 hypothetical protein DNHGIG_15320 [Collibacillus ludicampi]
MIEVYCDESRPETIYGVNSPDRFMVLGGLWVPYDIREDVKNQIKNLKTKYDVYGEFKWNRVSPSRLEFYLKLIDLFFKNSIRFRCIVVDSHFVDIDTYHESDSELGFYKFYYQLLYHWIDSRETYWIYLDHRKNKLRNRLHKLEEVLDKAIIRDTGQLNKIGDVQAIESKQSLLIQLTDILIGAVGYRMHRLNGSQAKLQVIERIESYLEHPIWPTPKSERKFNVFKIALRG